MIVYGRPDQFSQDACYTSLQEDIRQGVQQGKRSERAGLGQGQAFADQDKGA